MGRLHTDRPLTEQPLLSQVNASQGSSILNYGRVYIQRLLAITAAGCLLAPSISMAAEDSATLELVAQGTYPTLSIDSTGDSTRASVSRLQAMLKLLGFYQGPADGRYDEATQAAVTRFQEAAGLTADGITGPLTWARLLPSPEDITAVSTRTGSVSSAAPTLPAPEVPEAPTSSEAPADSAPPVLRLSAEGSAVTQLQRELQTLGYYSGTIDGIYGEQTQAAVTQFQTDQQLTADGVVGAATWDALSRALSQSAE